jgi:hypothetical protein
VVAPYFCEKCKFETGEFVRNCPRCGEALRSTRTVRITGWLLVVPGGGLTLGMAYLSFVVWILIQRADDNGPGARFTGDSTDAAMIYGVFGAVIGLSLTFVFAGIWQIVYGRRNKKLVFVALALAGAFWAFAEYFQNF